MTRSGAGTTRRRAGIAALQAEAVLGWRLVGRHPVSRAAFGWAVGLTALTRLVAGPAPDAAGPVAVGLAGLIAAAAGPRSFVRGGPWESLRWIGLPPGAAVVVRLAGTVAFACAGALVAAAVLAGARPVGPGVMAAAAVHATVVGALAAGMAPGLGCSVGTALTLLLVASAAGAPYATFVLEAGPPVVPLVPPGMLAIGLLEHWTAPHAAGLGVWLAIAALAQLGLVWRARGRRPARLAPPASPTPAVTVEHLTCADRTPGGAGCLLQDVTLTVDGGEIVAVVGIPATGPSALLRAAARLRRVDGGRVALARGVPRPVAGFGYVRGGLTGPAEITAIEWLHGVAGHYGGPARARTLRVQAALSLVGLAPEAGRRIGLLDRDMAERLAVATCAVSGTEVLILDGCFAGVHLATRQILTDALADLAAQGRAVLLAPGDVRAVESLATRVVVLRDGRLLADLRMSSLQQERVAELALTGGALAAVPRIAAHFPNAVRTGTGVDVPLTGGRTVEAVLALCRRERIPVLGTRVRYRAVDDLLAPPRSIPDPDRAFPLSATRR